MSLGEEGSRFFSIQNHLCKALLFKEGLGEVIKKLPFNTPLLGAGIIYLEFRK
jgi:hypothetical protein